MSSLGSPELTNLGQRMGLHSSSNTMSLTEPGEDEDDEEDYYDGHSKSVPKTIEVSTFFQLSSVL
jgi:hypothetical protein